MFADECRPQTLDDIIGQPKAIAKLKALTGRPTFTGGAFLLIGPSGSGKTSAARALCNDLGILEMDRFTIEPRGADLAMMRDADRFVHLRPWTPGGRFRAVLLDECHQADKKARDFLLGMLDPLPPNALIIGTSTEDDGGFDLTLLSRWWPIQFRQPTAQIIEAHVRALAPLHGLDLDAIPDLRRFCHERYGNVRAILNDVAAECWGGVAA